MRVDGEKLDRGTPARILRPVLRAHGLHDVAAEKKAWYAATRHTFASQFAMAGGSMQELQRIMGHSSIEETMRYAKLSPGYFSPGLHQLLGGPAPRERGKVIRIGHNRTPGRKTRGPRS